MKKFLLILAILLCAGWVMAKDIDMQVTFDFDPDFEADVEVFKLYYQTQQNPDTIVYLMDLTDVTSRVFITPTFDLPPGKTSELFVSAKYTSGEEEMSLPFPFKYTGKPTIIRADRVR